MKTTTGYIVAMFFLIVVAVAIIISNNQRRRAYIQSSHTYEFVVDLNSPRFADAIGQNLEQRTHQRVDRELIDPQNNIYRYRIKCPPHECKHIWAWLYGRKSVDAVYRE